MTDDEDAFNDADDEARIVVEEEDAPKRKPPKKKGKRTFWIVLAVIFIIILIAVPIAATFQMPAVNIVGAYIKQSGTGPGKTYKVFVTVEVINPNIVGCTVQNIQGKYYVNEVYGGDFSRPDSVAIAAGSSTQFDIEIIPKSSVPIHTQNTVRVTGTVDLVSPVTSWTIPFDETRDANL